MEELMFQRRSKAVMSTEATPKNKTMLLLKMKEAKVGALRSEYAGCQQQSLENWNQWYRGDLRESESIHPECWQ